LLISLKVMYNKRLKTGVRFLYNVGIYVEQIYIKDMIMSKELQTDLSMTAKTRRLA
jgi:hypothetical protein